MILAQAGDAGGTILQYGAIGAVLLLALYAIAKLYGRETQRADKAEAARDRLDAEIKALNADFRDKYLETLAETARVLAEATKVLASSQAAREVQK